MLHFFNTAGLEAFAGNLFLLFIWILKICLCSPPLPPAFSTAVSIPHISSVLLPKPEHSAIIVLINNWPQTQDTEEKLIQKKKKKKGCLAAREWSKGNTQPGQVQVLAEHHQNCEQLILMPESAISKHHLVFLANLAATLRVIRQNRATNDTGQRLSRGHTQPHEDTNTSLGTLWHNTVCPG